MMVTARRLLRIEISARMKMIQIIWERVESGGEFKRPRITYTRRKWGYIPSFSRVCSPERQKCQDCAHYLGCRMSLSWGVESADPGLLFSGGGSSPSIPLHETSVL